MHLKQPKFTYSEYSACGPFAKNKERMQQFKETGDTKYIYKNELDKACFQHIWYGYGDFKDLAKRIASDKVLGYKAFNVVKTQNMMDIKEVLLLWFINVLIKKLQVEQLKTKLNKMIN